MLLRHDIHDLFDANMIAIHPVTRCRLTSGEALCRS
ncbi:hypothetical protein ACLB1Q_33840 [Escherichia coli]